MHVIGTAGHIDHGKSALIKALTGMNPDRLQEEKERGMTIDLGFAWLTLPSGLTTGIIDVPGHHRFIRNMLAGVGGISLVLFVVAATESWMPQSQEHMDIIDLLGIDRGFVILTKKDLVEAEWLEMVSAEVGEKLAGTSLADAEIIPVSAISGEGLAYLTQRLDTVLTQVPPAADNQRPRLWIDRVFTIRGAGTVITGTLEQGVLNLEQVVQLMPSGVSARIRGLQTHQCAVTQALPGTRVAVNLAGVDMAQIYRGDALTGLGQWRANDVINVELRLLPHLTFTLPENSNLQLHIGSAEIPVQARLLGSSELQPGQSGFAQLRLARPAAIDFHDRFILRDITRQITIGGGKVLDAQAQRVRGSDFRLPRSAPGAYKVLASTARPLRRLDLSTLPARAVANQRELIKIVLQEQGWIADEELVYSAPLALPLLQTELGYLQQRGEIMRLPGYALAPEAWQALIARIKAQVRTYHDQYPLRNGLSRETLRSSMSMPIRLFDEVINRLVQEGQLIAQRAWLRLPQFTLQFSAEQRAAIQQLLAVMSSQRFTPPNVDELVASGYDIELINALIEQGQLVKVGKGVLFHDEALVEARQLLAKVIMQSGDIDVAAVRHVLGTTRKYAIPLLEYFDQIGFTKRVGDKRQLATGDRDSGAAFGELAN